MTALTDLQARLDAAKKIYHGLVQSSQHGDSRIQFVDIEKQERVIASLERDIAALSGRRPPSAGYARFSRGDGS